MNCCSECFSNSYLKNIINSNSSKGECNYCGSKDISIYNPAELSLFFQPILDLFSVDEEKGNLLEVELLKYFNGKIFSEKLSDNIRVLLEAIISDEFESYKHLFGSKVILTCLHDNNNHEKIKPLQISWENFAKEIKSTNRFHIKNALDLEKLKDLLGGRYDKEIIKGKIFHRARISGKEGFPVAEMYNPPAEKAKAGRANPIGISYLYIADQLKTTLYEARASLYDYVTIGEFRLKENIKVINLRGNTYDPIYLADNDLLEDFLIHLPFIEKLESELSKPRRRSDNELDYLPTQYLCEFIKSMGYDGVEFQSSLYSGGYNLAIFNPEKFECISVKVCDIENIELKHKVL